MYLNVTVLVITGNTCLIVRHWTQNDTEEALSRRKSLTYFSPGGILCPSVSAFL